RTHDTTDTQDARPARSRSNGRDRAGNEPPTGARTESYESMRVSRARAWLLAVAAWPITGLALAALVVVVGNHEYVPPVVLTVDANNHVAKTEVGTPEVLSSHESIVQGEIARYLTERFTLDRQFRDDHIRYVNLHSTDDVAATFAHEMDESNRNNPYNKLPAGAVQRVSDMRVRVTDKAAQQGEATFTTTADGSHTPTYWFVRYRYDFVKQALTPANRYINGTGFVMTAFEQNTEPGPR
ncbi:VirB8 family type IV secretion system protein, partial [Burkholderia cepacia]|uniref:type IV secretion system protein n=1 Tax=Burkholderia cepacia TaxID=292 RepID=UPI002ABDACB1